MDNNNQFTGQLVQKDDNKINSALKLPLHIVIFSKDRAIQLDSLLRSINDHFMAPYNSITVLFRASDDAFRNGYTTCKNDLSNNSTIVWVEEKDFRQDLITILNGFSKDSLVMFLVDDNVFYQPFTNSKVFEHLYGNKLFVNLIFFRSSEKDKYLHVKKKDNILTYLWIKRTKKGIYHCYPFSLDAHVYRVSIITKLIKGIQFKAPNSLEGALHKCARRLSVMRYWNAIAPDLVTAFNNPLNSVQLEGSTWNKGISPQMLNEKYLQGYRIDNEDVYKAKPDQMHFYHPISLVKK